MSNAHQAPALPSLPWSYLVRNVEPWGTWHSQLVHGVHSLGYALAVADPGGEGEQPGLSLHAQLPTAARIPSSMDPHLLQILIWEFIEKSIACELPRVAVTERAQNRC